MLTTLIVLPILIYCLYRVINYYYSRNDNYWPDRGVHLIKVHEIASLYRRLTFQVRFMDIESKFYEATGDRKYSGYMQLGKPILFLKDLDIAKQILVKDFDHFLDRQNIDLSDSDPVLHYSLLNLGGQKWKDIRSAVSPTFTTGKIKRMFIYFNTCAETLITQLLKVREKEIDMENYWGRFTTDVIARTVFGVETDVYAEKEPQFSIMAKRLNSLSLLWVIKVFIFITMPFIHKLFNYRLADPTAMEFFETLVKKALSFREKECCRDDFLQIMLDAKNGALEKEEIFGSFETDAQINQPIKKKNVINDSIIMAQSLLFFSAGYDTTECTLLFATHFLAINPEVQQKLYNEIQQGFNAGDGLLTYDVVNHMEYLDMVVSETLRKCPPAFRLERKCTTEYTVPSTGLVIEKDTIVAFPVYPIHMDPKYYPNPNQFIPERFTAENKAKRHPYAYMPFGHGPRNCIGMRFALMEVKVALAHLVRNFCIEPCSKTEIPIQFHKKTAVLKPANGVWVTLTPRD